VSLSRWGACIVAGTALGGCNAQSFDFDDSEAGAPDATAIRSSSDAAQLDAPFDSDRDGGGRRPPADASFVDSPSTGPSLGECHNESDCARFMLHCLIGDASSGTCVPCLSNGDCPDTVYSRCDLSMNRCVQCDVDSDCRQNEVCLADVTHTCIPSCAEVPCPPGAGYCDLTRNMCLGCTNDAECDRGYVCNTASNRCAYCSTDNDCHPPRGKCDETIGKCVECLHNSDCGRGVCISGGLCLVPVDSRSDE
jgi:Cys-rich repeat protein